MGEKVKFKACVSTNIVGSTSCRIFYINKEDLDGVPEEDWPTYVFDELGGEDLCNSIGDRWIEKVEA